MAGQHCQMSIASFTSFDAHEKTFPLFVYLSTLQKRKKKIGRKTMKARENRCETLKKANFFFL
ncbi:hypothetical protein BDZ91DRAFT_129216 [Kalaharituber pfeilii]|nr:hypothetical protein BDZ91DRAFT_129216 [Kalaharituber pfeilii]